MGGGGGGWAGWCRVVACQKLGRKSADLLATAVLSVPLNSADLVGWPGLLASEFREYAICIPRQQVLVAVAAEKSMTHRWKWQ